MLGTVKSKKIIVVHIHDVGRADAPKRVGHFYEVATEIGVVRVTDVFDIKMGKNGAAVLKTFRHYLVHQTVSKQKPVRQPRLLGMPQHSKREEMSPLKRHDDG